MSKRCRNIFSAAWLIGAFLVLGMSGLGAQPQAPITLRVVGGLGGVSQFMRFEEPFWRDSIPALTNGQVRTTIQASDHSGIRGQEMLQLMRLGVVPFGTALLAVVSNEEPEFNAIDLPAVSPDMATLRRTVADYRPHLQALLADRYNVELLAVYTYPAQVLFCRRAFRGLSDLAGRRVRTSSVGQSEMMSALGAVPVVIPFAEIPTALRAGVVECAITGTLSGNAIGLHEVTTHVHEFAVTWGLSFFGANRTAWNALPEPLRATLRREIGALEQRVWEAVEQETGEGLACNAGRSGCVNGRRGSMTVVPASDSDQALRRRLLTETVLPGWVRRCGPDCAEAWNRRLAHALGVQAPAE